MPERTQRAAISAAGSLALPVQVVGLASERREVPTSDALVGVAPLARKTKPESLDPCDCDGLEPVTAATCDTHLERTSVGSLHPRYAVTCPVSLIQTAARSLPYRRRQHK